MTAPRWVTLYLGIATTMAFVFSILAYLDPTVQFAPWTALGTAGATSLVGPMGLYISRNVATVALSGFALLNREPAALTGAFIMRAVTDALDAAHNSIGGNIPGAAFATAMLVIELVALYHLRTSVKR